MNVPVSNQLATNRGLVAVWIEETMGLDFDLSGEGDYVETGAVEGKIQIDFELNRSGLMDRLDRAESPSWRDQLNMRLENWTDDAMTTSTVELDYGRLLLKGAEPTQLESDLELDSTFPTEELRTTSPEELKRKLRKERSYEMTYDDLAEDVSAYLEREGIVADPSFSAPIHMQASAIPAEDGTDFTLIVENNEASAIHEITIKVDMPQEVGREAEVGHAGDHAGEWTSEPAVSGAYNPEEAVFEFDVNSLSPADGNDDRDQGSRREVRFHVPARAQGTLDEISGEARFTRDKPFSNIEPVAVFDAGGHRLEGDLGDVEATGHVDATFETSTEAITVGSKAEVKKRFRVEGITPIDAFNEIEEIVQDRGIEGAEFNSPTQSRDIREGKATYDGSIRNGSVLIGDSRVSVNIHVDGEVRASDQETATDTDDDLPTERRSITVNYGSTGINIIGKGADQNVVENYVSDLRDELQMSMQSIAEAM